MKIMWYTRGKVRHIMDTLKYKLSNKKEDIIKVGEHTLHRIIALKDIIDEKGKVLVHSGDKGGYVESESNLSHYDTCWIYDEAMAYESSQVNCAAELHNRAVARDGVTLWGMVQAFDDVQLYGTASLYGKPKFYDFARVSGCAQISGEVILSGDVWVGGNEKFTGNVKLESGTYVTYVNEYEAQ